MAATVLDGAVIETGGIVAAGALVTPGKIVKEGELWAGSPAKLFRTISQQEVSEFLSGAEGYRKLAQEYRAALD